MSARARGRRGASADVSARSPRPRTRRPAGPREARGDRARTWIVLRLRMLLELLDQLHQQHLRRLLQVPRPAVRVAGPGRGPGPGRIGPGRRRIGVAAGRRGSVAAGGPLGGLRARGDRGMLGALLLLLLLRGGGRRGFGVLLRALDDVLVEPVELLEDPLAVRAHLLLVPPVGGLLDALVAHARGAGAVDMPLRLGRRLLHPIPSSPRRPRPWTRRPARRMVTTLVVAGQRESTTTTSSVFLAIFFRVVFRRESGREGVRAGGPPPLSGLGRRRRDRQPALHLRLLRSLRSPRVDVQLGFPRAGTRGGMARLVDVHDNGDFAFNDAALPSSVSDALAQVIIAQSKGDAADWSDAASRIVTELKARIPELLRDVRAHAASTSRRPRYASRVSLPRRPLTLGRRSRAERATRAHTGGPQHPGHHAAALAARQPRGQPDRDGGGGRVPARPRGGQSRIAAERVRRRGHDVLAPEDRADGRARRGRRDALRAQDAGERGHHPPEPAAVERLERAPSPGGA